MPFHINHKLHFELAVRKSWAADSKDMPCCSHCTIPEYRTGETRVDTVETRIQNFQFQNQRGKSNKHLWWLQRHDVIQIPLRILDQRRIQYRADLRRAFFQILASHSFGQTV